MLSKEAVGLEGTFESMFVAYRISLSIRSLQVYDTVFSFYLGSEIPLLYSSYILFYSGVKMVNQLLAGVHIASGAEAMAFGARLGLNTRTLFDFITNSEGTSW